MQQHTPVYQFQGHSQEGASTSQHPFTSSASHHPSPPPHPPLSPLQQVSASTSGAARHASPYVPPQGGYSQLGYPTPSQYGYASPSSFGPSSSLYPPQYGAYSQSYGTSDQDGQGTWWYLPPGGPTTTSYEGMQPPFPYGINYPPMASHDGETYGHSPSSPHPAASTPASPSHARPPNPSRFGGSSSQLSVAGPSSVRPVSASSAAPVRTAENPEPSTAGESERHPSRRPYHPNPPAHRSEWVMWAGNVPSDATHDELWRFFNQPLSRSASTEPGTSTSPEDISDGVVSIFLISRSNCAFVNFESERHLNAATVRFNGVPLRPADPRCPRLVCRIRRQTDDLRAGVGGQRGIGMHTKWIKEQREKAKQAGGHSDTASAMTTPEELGQGLLKLSLSDDDNPRNRNATSHSNSSGSFASTTSSVMARYFPRRYFILKSLTQFDLDLSVQRGVWATQRHNEGILDQAFRTSQEVFLIFGVNKSGEFYGYAKMAGPVSQGESKVPWASPLASSQSSQASKGSLPAEADSSPLDHRTGVHYFLQSDGHYVDESPAAVSSAQDHPPVLPNPASRGKMASAPAELGDPHQRLTHKTPQEQMSLNDRRPIPVSHPPIELDDMAPYRNLKDHRGDESEEETRRTPNASGDRGVATEAPHPPHVRREVSEPLLTSTVLGPVQESVKEEDEAHEHPPIADAVPPSTEHGEEEVWGQPFRIQWVRTERLPFYRTRHLRNPWNHGREVKVSRDGTELEPSVGQQLLDEWDRPPPSPSTSPAAAPRPPAQRRGSKPPH
ncbi:hypothetical protein FA95DRAFT_1503717 [Auriscalpium vulgare]|uniref:Uncharacterized protein n=1 Tax=Auriscalpium vulgare TaxID=40419 RepID=A0ACB8R825_9AGAM|nr:hypothetical protein FA95DRAFT_1503717 [Auriscalpium vulgare]